MKKINRQGLMTVLCIMMIAFTSLGLTMAYFSDYTSASGQAVISLKAETVIEENVDKDGIKHITLSNPSETTDVVARVVIYGPWLTAEDQAKDVQAPEDWEYKDGFYYYTKIIPAGGETSEIVIKHDNVPKDLENFDITVKFQSALVTLDGDKVAKPDGWDYIPAITE